MAQQDFAIKETTQVASEGISLQTVANSITNIVVIIVSHLFPNNEIFLHSCLPLDLFKLADVKLECIIVHTSV